MNNDFKNKTFFDAMKNALNGIKYTFINERNLKIQFCIAILVMACGIVFSLSRIEWAILVLTIFIVFISENINTAIEQTVNLETEEYNEKAKIAKDAAAGAVTLASFMSVIIGLIIFIPKIIEFVKMYIIK